VVLASPEQDGQSFGALSSSGGPAPAARLVDAENIAAGQRSAAEVVVGWMDRPGHRHNILNAQLHQIGVGHATGGTYGVLWTQVFGTPR
jgi:uncharacterized protein YkwD